MEILKISEETKNKILLYSAQSLPDKPGERGMKAQDTKLYFYKYISVLVEELNKVLESLINGVATDIEGHNSLEAAHPLLRKLISDLQTRDTELGNSIGAQINAHNSSSEAHSDIREKIASDINTHNASSEAHSDIRTLITALDTLAKDAYNLASGKSKVLPRRAKDFFYDILEGNYMDGINIGDIIVFADTALLPDFVVYEKNIEVGKSDIEISDYSNGHGPDECVELFSPGATVYIGGTRFITVDSGIDTSKFATAAALSSSITTVKSLISSLETRMNETDLVIERKEESLLEVESTEPEIMLATHTEYNLGLVTELMVSLPENTDGIEAIINFRCGATAASIDMPDEILFQGDDTLDGRIYPITNRLYEINIKKVMGIIIAKVGAVDYEVIE